VVVRVESAALPVYRSTPLLGLLEGLVVGVALGRVDGENTSGAVRGTSRVSNRVGAFSGAE